MVLLPGCVCCSPTCFLSAPYPEYIEIDIDFEAASGIGVATATAIVTQSFFEFSPEPGYTLLQTSTTTTVHTTVPASGAYTVRLTHLGSGLFSSPVEGAFLSATVVENEIFLTVTPAVCAIEATSQLVYNYGKPTESESQSFPDSTRSFLCRFQCFGITVNPGDYPYILPDKYAFSVGTELKVPNRQFCAGTIHEFADRNMTVSKSAEAMFPFTVHHGWSGSHFESPITDFFIDLLKITKQASAVVSYGEMSTHPPPLANSIGRLYGFTTHTTFSDIRIKPSGGEPFSIASAFDASRPVHGGSVGPARADCAEWLLIT